MKKNSNIFSDDFSDFQPKKMKTSKGIKSKQISFSELDYDDSYQKKRYKNDKYKIY